MDGWMDECSSFKKIVINLIHSGASFLILAGFLKTMSPTVSVWECVSASFSVV